MKQSHKKVCCPHCIYETAKFTLFSNGKIRDGIEAMEQHRHQHHKGMERKKPIIIDVIA